MANAVNVNFRMDPDLKRNMEAFDDDSLHDFCKESVAGASDPL